MIADLHTHSTASDGQYTPEQLVHLAKDRGIEVLALTDHDTVDGVAEAARTGDGIGVKIIRGVELGAMEYRNLHILGYGFTDQPCPLTELCEKLRAGRDERKYRIRDFLKEKGVDISLEEVEQVAGGNVIARPHFAQVMVRHGYVATPREAFDRYLDTSEYSRIERFKASAEACISAIKTSGGMASFAHPYQVKLDDEALEALLRSLIDAGLDAIECYHSGHTPQQQAFYLSLAERYHLHVTGGSDFHGERVKPNIRLTGIPLELDWLL